MTTGVNLRKVPRRGSYQLPVGVPVWLPLVECAIASSEDFTCSIFQVETGLNDSNFTWGPFRLIETKTAIPDPICLVIGDALQVELWAKVAIAPNTIEVVITAH